MKTVQSINLRFWDRVFCQNSLRFRVGFTVQKGFDVYQENDEKALRKRLPLDRKDNHFMGPFRMHLRCFEFNIFGKTFLLYTSCLVNRPHYCARLMRFGSRDPSDFSSRIRPRNVLTEKI